MALMNEDFSPTGIKNVTLEDLIEEKELQEAAFYDAAHGGEESEADGKMGLAFAHAADMGVARIKHSIVSDEINIRDHGGEDEIDLNQLLAQLFGQ